MGLSPVLAPWGEADQLISQTPVNADAFQPAAVLPRSWIQTAKPQPYHSSSDPSSSFSSAVLTWSWRIRGRTPLEPPPHPRARHPPGGGRREAAQSDAV